MTTGLAYGGATVVLSACILLLPPATAPPRHRGAHRKAGK